MKYKIMLKRLSKTSPDNLFQIKIRCQKIKTDVIYACFPQEQRIQYTGSR